MVALDLLTPALNTQFPSTRLSFQIQSSLFISLPHFHPRFSLLIPIFLFSFCCPSARCHLSYIYPVTSLLCWPFCLLSHALRKSPITHALLFPVLTNAGVRPGTRQVCHKQVGGTGREREGMQDNAGNS